MQAAGVQGLAVLRLGFQEQKNMRWRRSFLAARGLANRYRHRKSARPLLTSALRPRGLGGGALLMAVAFCQ
jgi:hypothetical protein